MYNDMSDVYNISLFLKRIFIYRCKPDCRFGDRVDTCYQFSAHDCYDPTTRSKCCKYCGNLEDPTKPGEFTLLFTMHNKKVRL